MTSSYRPPFGDIIQRVQRAEDQAYIHRCDDVDVDNADGDDGDDVDDGYLRLTFLGASHQHTRDVGRWGRAGWASKCGRV